MRTDHVKWEWTTPDGDVWNLTSGDRGVKMSTEQSGLHWPDVKHVWSDNGIDRLGVEVGRLEPTLKLQIGVGMTGMDYYNCLNDWQHANSPHRLGTLRCTRPDGTYREQKFYLRESPDTVWKYDPGAGIEDNPDEVWPLVSPESWWDSSEVTQWKVSGSDVPTDPTKMKYFFGDGSRGWPLYVSEGKIYLRNQGDAPLWASWEFRGSETSFRAGLIDPSYTDADKGRLLKGMTAYNLYSADDPAILRMLEGGYRIKVNTDPLHPLATVGASGFRTRPAWSVIDAASFLPVMPGERKLVYVGGLNGEAVPRFDATITVRPRYALPF